LLTTLDLQYLDGGLAQIGAGDSGCLWIMNAPGIESISRPIGWRIARWTNGEFLR